MKRSVIAAILLLGTSLAAHALEQDVWDDIRKPWRSDAEMPSAVKADAKACEREVGVQRGPLTAKFKECMLRHDWKFSHIKPQPAPRVVVHRYNNNGGSISSFDSSNDDAVRIQRDQDNTQQMINNQQTFDNQQRMNDEQASQNQQQMINAQ